MASAHCVFALHIVSQTMTNVYGSRCNPIVDGVVTKHVNANVRPASLIHLENTSPQKSSNDSMRQVGVYCPAGRGSDY